MGAYAYVRVGRCVYTCRLMRTYVQAHATVCVDRCDMYIKKEQAFHTECCKKTLVFSKKLGVFSKKLGAFFLKLGMFSKEFGVFLQNFTIFF